MEKRVGGICDRQWGECRGNASDCRVGLVVVGCVGFHSNFGVFKRSRHRKTVTRLAIINGFPFNPTYESGRGREEEAVASNSSVEWEGWKRGRMEGGYRENELAGYVMVSEEGRKNWRGEGEGGW